ncbi:MAG: hypothetical protein J0I64_17125 [Devosia sp.]|nr:hypothetical protein [Devosia sp.]
MVGGLVSIDGQLFAPRQLERHGLWYCPECALEQVEASPHLGADAAIAVTRDYIVSAIGGCFRHRRPFIYAGRAQWRGAAHDTAMVMVDVVKQARRAVDAVAQAWAPSSIDLFVAGSLNGKVDDIPLLRDLNMHQVLSLCGLFGKWAMDADELRVLGRQQLNEVLSTGLDVLRDEAEGIGRVLQRQFDDREVKGPVAASTMMGSLWDALWAVAGDPAHRPVRDAVVTAATLVLPSRNQATMFNQPIGERALASPARVGAEFGLGKRTVRVFARMASALHEDIGDWINVPIFRAWWEDDDGLILLKDSGQPYGANLKTTNRLVKHGLLTPVTSHSSDERGVAYIRRGQYQRLMQDLLANAVPCPSVPDGAATLFELTSRVVRNDQAGQVYRMILRNEIWTGSLQGQLMYPSILVDVAEVQKKLRSAVPWAVGNGNDEWLLAPEFAKACGIGSDALHALTGPIFTCERRTQPASGLKRKHYRRSDADRFHQQYITLNSLAPLLRMQRRHVVSRLAERGVHPLDMQSEKITIFERDHLMEILSQ